jgi:hypothetical protein
MQTTTLFCRNSTIARSRTVGDGDSISLRIGASSSMWVELDLFS